MDLKKFKICIDPMTYEQWSKRVLKPGYYSEHGFVYLGDVLFDDGIAAYLSTTTEVVGVYYAPKTPGVISWVLIAK